MRINKFGHAQRGRHLPRDHRALDHVARQCLGHLRHGHADGSAAQRLDQPGHQPGGAAHRAPLHIVRGFNRRAAHMHLAGAVDMHGDRAHAFEFILHMHLIETPCSPRRGLGIAADERQVKHFGTQEAAWRVARQRPDDINDAIARLIEQRRRSAPQRHGRIHLDRNAAVGFLHHLLCPGFDELRRYGGLRGQEMVHAQRDLLRGGTGDPHRTRQRG